MDLASIIGFVIIVASILLTVLASFTGLGDALPKGGGGLLDTASFICVIGPVIGGVLMAYGSELSTAFKTDPTRTESINAVGVYKLAIRVSIGSGFIGTLIG